MTVPSQTNRDQQTGDGISAIFTVPFRILDQTHIEVLATIGDVTTTLVLTTDYAVTGVGNPNTTVTFVVPPAIGTVITFLRDVPLTQETDYVPNDPFPAESHERALDKLTMIAQQVSEVVDRTVVLPPQTSGVSTELPGPQALYLLRWNAAETALENVEPPAIATVADGAVVDATVSPIAAIQSTKIDFINSGSGAVHRALQDKLRETVSSGDYASLAQAISAAAGRPFNLLNGAWGGTPYADEIPANKIRIVAGTVRQNAGDPTRWDWISDVGHIPVGFLTGPSDIAVVANTDLVLTFPETFGQVIALVAGPDEEFASTYSATVGASVALDSVTLRMAVNMRAAGRVWYDGAAWQHREMSAGGTAVGATPVFAAGVLTVQHGPRVFGGVWNPAVLGADTRNGAVVPYMPALKDSSATTEFTASFVDLAGTGLVAVADTKMSFNYAKQFTGPIRLNNSGGSVGMPLSNGNIWMIGVMKVA